MKFFIVWEEQDLDPAYATIVKANSEDEAVSKFCAKYPEIKNKDVMAKEVDVIE